jgi:hypothetical protein
MYYSLNYLIINKDRIYITPLWYSKPQGTYLEVFIIQKGYL